MSLQYTIYAQRNGTPTDIRVKLKMYSTDDRMPAVMHATLATMSGLLDVPNITGYMIVSPEGRKLSTVGDYWA